MVTTVVVVGTRVVVESAARSLPQEAAIRAKITPMKSTLRDTL
jgi:hypothetical protein